MLLVLLGADAPAQPPEGPKCEAYQPSADEITDVADASTGVPSNAELHSACVTRTLFELRPGQLGEIDTTTYRFLWNAAEPYRGVRVLHQAECTRTYTGSITCDVLDLAGQQQDGELVELQGIASAKELSDFFAFRDRRLGSDYRPISIWRKGRMDVVHGYHGDGRQIGYDLAKTCASTNECTWNVLRQYEWRY
jgi:hypothetical protein